MVQVAMKRKMEVLLVLDRLAEDDDGVPLSGSNGLRIGKRLLHESIPLGRLIVDGELAKHTGHPYLKRVGISTMFTGQESFYAKLVRGAKDGVEANEDYLKSVHRYAKHLQAIHSKCPKLHTIILFGRSSARVFDDALARLHQENMHVAEALQQLEIIRLPSLSRVNDSTMVELTRVLVK